MMSTPENNFQNVAAQQPVFVQVVPSLPAPVFNFAPVLQHPVADMTATPSLTALNQCASTSLTTTPLPIFSPSLPIVSQQPPMLTQVTSVPASTNIMFYDGNTVSQVPSYLMPTISQQGTLTPPVGFSFATIDFTPQSVGDSDSTGNVEELTQSSSSPEPTPDPAVAPTNSVKKPRKFKHGSKQERIMQVYEAIQKKYTAQGVYAGEHEVLRGADTVRVHVKTYKGLDKIEAALQEVDDCPDVRLRKLATPFSMKNRFQKKGFIVYLRLQSPDMVDSVKAVFKKYEEYFRKCDVAMPKPTDPQPTEPVDTKISDFLDAESGKGSTPFFPMPLPMVKQSSVPGDAA